MNTKIINIDKDNIDGEALKEAGQIIRDGGLVAFPTETVYGLGANALDAQAAMKVYAAKGRPSDNPLIAHICDIEMLKPLVKKIPPVAEKLMDAFWPGPLTLIFEKSDIVPKGTTGGLDTVAIRFPNHPIASRLIKEAGTSIAAPSANLSGKPSPTLGEHVIDDLDGRIDMIIDGGMVGMGLESTIIDVTVDPPLVLRPGFITYEMAKKVVSNLEIDQAILKKPVEGLKPKAPGMKYKHYAPKADMVIVDGPSDAVVSKINALVHQKQENGQKVAVIATEESGPSYHADVILSMGSRLDEDAIAQHLYRILRECDELHVDAIYSESFQTPRIGQAIMNRLLKAAGHTVIHCD